MRAGFTRSSGPQTRLKRCCSPRAATQLRLQRVASLESAADFASHIDARFRAAENGEVGPSGTVNAMLGHEVPAAFERDRRNMLTRATASFLAAAFARAEGELAAELRASQVIAPPPCERARRTSATTDAGAPTLGRYLRAERITPVAVAALAAIAQGVQIAAIAATRRRTKSAISDGRPSLMGHGLAERAEAHSYCRFDRGESGPPASPRDHQHRACYAPSPSDRRRSGRRDDARERN
jgi:hypothetical protein